MCFQHFTDKKLPVKDEIKHFVENHGNFKLIFSFLVHIVLFLLLKSELGYLYQTMI